MITACTVNRIGVIASVAAAGTNDDRVDALAFQLLIFLSFSLSIGASMVPSATVHLKYLFSFLHFVMQQAEACFSC